MGAVCTRLDDEFLESPTNVSLTTGSSVTMRCVHRFGKTYIWFSNEKRLLHNDTDKVHSACVSSYNA